MSSQPFVHLHCHSHYSLLDGASPIEGLISKAKASGMNALALTDHGNLYGALEFYQAAKAGGINPILGYEAYIAPDSRFRKEANADGEASYHLTLLAQNRTGFQNLVKLASAAYLEGFYRKPRIDKEILQAHSEGLICLSGCVSGEFSRFLLRGGDPALNLKEACDLAGWFQKLFGERYFIEIQNNGLEIQRLALEGAVDVARQVGIPLVATSDAHYVNREDAEAQDVLLCINTGKFRTDTNRMRMEGDQFYLRAPEEMYAAFAGLEDAVRQSQAIADTVDIQLELGKRHFPTFTLPPEKTATDYLRELCLQGLTERYADQPEMCSGGVLSEVVLARLDRELAVINKLGFPNYFLIVWDFVRFARERDIPATARGSGVGSVVSYGLKLSHVCPLKYDLLFERFLDESRLEAPDIDIDFCQDRRSEVIDYVKQKYGEANVAQIGTFGTLAAKAAIRDVGRALGWPIPRVDALIAMVPGELNIELSDALEKSEELKKAYETDAEARELLDLARKVEGLARNVGTHAAAVVIADRPLVEYVPLQRVKDKEEIITQWAMGDVEAAGLLKMDFLGLRNLTILAKAVDLIEQTTGERIDPYKFPMHDAETFALLCRGETKGIFQLESGGIRDLLQRMKPDHFRDIIATNALYRPGPLEGGMVDDYIQVKHGRKPAEYPHPVMKEILEETHGVMVYQEQVMRIINGLGGIELSSAYTCIKAISKKKLPTIAKFREEFVAGACEKGLSKNEAAELFGMIEKFAGYGFNKCVVGETMVIDADSGDRVTVESLFRERRAFRIHSLGADGKLRPRPVEDVVWNGRKPVFTLRTIQGKTIRATANHPLLTFEGWKNLGDLRPGDQIAAPRRLEIQSPRRGLAGQPRATPWVHGRRITGTLKACGARSAPSGRPFPPHPFRVHWVPANVPTQGVALGYPAMAPSGRLALAEDQSDIFWDRVASIEPSGIEDTYDLTVAEDHNFVADGLIVHNSHSTAYALIAYMTAYLKAHYPVEFMAALLCGDTDKRNFKRKDPLVEHMEDCRRMEIDVLPPDVNRSNVEFAVAEGKIHFALSALKGCGEQAAAAIVAARKAAGPFTSLFDFCERIDPTLVNRAAIETLIKAGAFDSIGARRSQLMAVVERALQSGASKLADRRSGQKGLFDSLDDTKTSSAPVKLPEVPEWPEREKLANEKEVLGFYLTSHPLAEHDATLRTFCSHTTVTAAALPGRSDVLVGGMLSSIKFSHTKNPRPGSTATKYAMFDLEDMEGILRCIVWPEEFGKFGEMVAADAILILRGRIDKRPGSEEANLIVDELMSPADMSERYTKGMIVRVQEEAHGVRGLEQLHEILRGYPGNLSLELLLCLADGSKVRCTCEGLRVGIDAELRGRIDELLGEGNVRMITAKPTPTPAPKARGNGYARQPVRA